MSGADGVMASAETKNQWQSGTLLQSGAAITGV